MARDDPDETPVAGPPASMYSPSRTEALTGKMAQDEQTSRGAQTIRDEYDKLTEEGKDHHRILDRIESELDDIRRRFEEELDDVERESHEAVEELEDHVATLREKL